MAQVLRQTQHHSCHDEIDAPEFADLYLGSIIQCSCGKQYVRAEHQFDGRYWQQLPADKRLAIGHGYTSHGHPCCGQCPARPELEPQTVARCGGPGLCSVCGHEAIGRHATPIQRATETGA